jgi:hypothetical protein
MDADSLCERGDVAMRMSIAGLVLLLSSGIAAADELLGPPRVLQPELPPPPVYYRRSAYEVWQNLSVDRRGFFRARVIDTPYGAFYRYNGEPYFWTSTLQHRYMPGVID